MSIWPFKPSTSKQIARIEIAGAIGSGTRKAVLTALKTVEEKKFPALLLRIDSPGGTVGDSYEIYMALLRLQKKIKIVASYGNISASGGIFIGMGAPHIVSNPGTVTDKIGVSFQTVKSGAYKDILSFDRELTAPEQEILQTLIDSSYAQFIQIVSSSRNIPIEQVKTFSDGRIFTGEQSLALGMVDRLGSEEDARRWAAELAGLDPEKTKCCNIEERKPFLTRLLQRQMQSLGINTTVDWIQFEVANNGLPLWLYRP
jgi:protease IV